MFYKSGGVCEENWENDIQNGKGIMYFKNGDIYNGLFKNGEINGYGIYKWKKMEKFFKVIVTSKLCQKKV